MRATRRRGAALESAILGAAVEELLAGGYAGLTMDGVAARAGTNKNAVYRRWSSRALLVVAAYRHLREGATPTPDTGSLRGDVLALLRGIGRSMTTSQGQVQQSIMAAAAADPAVRAALREQVVDGAGVASWREVLERAIERGEASSTALHPRVAGLPLALLRHEHLVRGPGARVPDGVLVEIVDLVFLPLVTSPRRRSPQRRSP